MAKILSFDNKLMKIGNGLLGPAEVVPPGPANYKVKFMTTVNYGASVIVTATNPSATSGYVNGWVNGSSEASRRSLTTEELNNGISVTFYDANRELSFTYEGVTGNALTFNIKSININYILYSIIDGVETEVKSGAAPSNWSGDPESWSISLT